MSSDVECNIRTLKLLAFDHKRIQDLLFHCEQSMDPSHKLSFAQTAFNELTVHTHIEEEIFYPYIKRTASDEARTLIDAFFREHITIDAMVAKLIPFSEFTPETELQFELISQELRGHIHDEETELFPLLIGLDKDTDEAVYEQMRQRRLSLMRQDTAKGNETYTPKILLFETIPNELDMQQNL